MVLAITKYIYPIEREIELSQSMEFRPVNPRNENEKNIGKEFIVKTFNEIFKQEQTFDSFVALLDNHMPKWKFNRDQLNRIPFSHLDWRY
jgi:hypothetical protein